MCEFFPRLELVRARPKIPLHAKDQPRGLLYIYIYTLARIRLLGRFTTCLTQTTTALRLLFALGWHFMPRECEFFLEIFEFKNCQKFCTIMMT